MATRIKYYLLFLALIAYAMFFTDKFRFDLIYSTYTDSFNTYFIPALADGSLFRGDRVAAAFREVMRNPWAREFPFFFYYSRASLLVPLYAAAKITAVLLAMFSAVLLYKRAYAAYGDDRPAFFYSITTMAYFLSMDSFYYGQNRAFGVSLFFLLVYLIYSERYALTPLFIYAFYIFYPYLALPAALISIVAFFRVPAGGRRLLYLFSLLAGAAMTAMTDIKLDAGINTAVAFGYKLKGLAGGAVDPKNIADLVMYYALNMNEHRAIYSMATVFFLVCAGLAVWLRGRAAFSILKGRPALPLAMFPLSFALLYPVNPLFASRQLVFALPFALAALFADNVLFFLRGRHLMKASAAAAAVFIAANLFHGRIEDFSDYKRVYAAITDLPKTARLAAAPDSRLAGGIPYYAGRAVFYNDATSEVLSAAAPGLDQAAERGELEKAMCSAAPDAAMNFSRKYGIDYLLVETAGPRNGPVCGGKETAALAAAKKGKYVFREETPYGPVFLLRPGMLKN